MILRLARMAAMIIAAVLLCSCPDVFGKYDNPVDPDAPNYHDPKMITEFAFVNPAASGVANTRAKTIMVFVPSSTDFTSLVATFSTTGISVKVGSTVQESGVTPNDFTNPVTYTVTAFDGTTVDYIVTVTLNPAKAISTFSFANPAATGVINEAAKTIAVTLPYLTDVTALLATFTTTGESVEVGSTPQVSGTTANNFTNPVTYTVTAADSTTAIYVVTVTVALNPAKAITAFSFTSPAATGVINEAAKTIAVNVPYGTNVTALVATFTTTCESVKVGSTVQVSGTTANNFANPVTYTVTAADSSTANYVVTVTVALNPAKAITAFSFTSPVATGVINEAAKTIAVTVPYLTDVTALVATFTTTGKSVKVGSTVQVSGTTANNFTNPVTYTVTAADSTTANYVVTVTVALNPAKRTTAGNRSWTCITSSSDGTKLAAGVSVDSIVGYIYTSADDGATWTERTAAGNHDWRCIASSADGTKLAAGDADSYVYTSTDSGATWTQRTNAGDRWWVSIASSEDGTNLAACVFWGGYIYTSTDSGATWTERTAAGSRFWISISSSADGSKLVACANGGYIYTSTDSGATWTERTSAGYRQWYSIASSADGTRLVACVNYGCIYTSTDSGVTWTERTAAEDWWQCITSSADGTKLAACAHDVSGWCIYTSRDSGATWTQRASAGRRLWSSITSSADGAKLAACVDGGYIYTGE